MAKGTDLRIVKTDRAIFEALIRLLAVSSFEDLKVSRICKEAMVNRTTFYSHFEDKYALFQAFIDYLKHDLKQRLATNENLINTKEYYIEVIRILTDNIGEKKGLFKALLAHNEVSIVLTMVYRTLKEDIVQRLEKDSAQNHISARFIANYYLGAVCHVVVGWIREDDGYTKEEMIKYLEELIPEKIF